MIFYLDYPSEQPQVSREFESALAAFRCGDPNPMRKYLNLPLQGVCEDCGEEAVVASHDYFALICRPCAEIRDAEIESLLRDVGDGWHMSTEASVR